MAAADSKKDSPDPWRKLNLYELTYEAIPKGWEPFFQQKEIQDLLQKISKELSEQAALDSVRIFPRPQEVFRALDVPPTELRAVIMGQDPYPNFDSAEGLCFSVRKGNKINPSLKNIFTALKAQGFAVPKVHGSLQDWVEEGVLLLNTALTVREGQPNSHRSLWAPFTDALIDYVLTHTDKVVWMLWGRQAQRLSKKIEAAPDKKFKVLSCVHPSPLCGHRFVQHQEEHTDFLRCNVWLLCQGQAAIRWDLS